MAVQNLISNAVQYSPEATHVGVGVRVVDDVVEVAITDKGAPLAQALLDDLRASDPEEAARLQGVTAELLVGVRNTVGVRRLSRPSRRRR